MTSLDDIGPAFARLVDAFATREPLPAGGAAGVTSIALGVALGTKVLALTRADDGARCPLEQRLREILDRTWGAFRADCEAFECLLAALRRPRADDARGAAVQQAWRRATRVPVSVANLAAEAEALLQECTVRIKQSMAGDVEAALALVRAGRRIAESNAHENSRRLDPNSARELLAELDDRASR